MYYNILFYLFVRERSSLRRARTRVISSSDSVVCLCALFFLTWQYFGINGFLRKSPSKTGVLSKKRNFEIDNYETTISVLQNDVILRSETFWAIHYPGNIIHFHTSLFYVYVLELVANITMNTSTRRRRLYNLFDDGS